MTNSTCPDSTCRFRNRFGYCTVTTCVAVPTKVAIHEDHDLVRVVHCRDCKYSKRMCQPWNDLICDKHGGANMPDWFCADGEREE